MDGLSLKRTLSFETLFLSTNEGMIFVDDDTTCLDANPAACRMFGTSLDHLIGQKINFTSTTIPDLNQVWKNPRPPGEPLPDWHIQRPDGENRILKFEVLSNLLPNCHLLVIRDVTELQKDKASLQLLAAIVEFSDDAIYSWDAEGIVNSWNPGAERIFGYTADEILGHSNQILTPVDRRDELLGILNRIKQGKPIHQFETERIRKDGQLIQVVYSIAPILDENKRMSGASVIIRDITQRKQLEDQLRQAHKMEAIGRLAGGVAHDFNNLLTVIIGYSQLLLNALPTGPPPIHMLHEIKKAGERASELTRQLLAFSRKQLLKPVVLNLNTQIVELEKMLGRLIGEDISLEFILDPDLGPVRADASQIEQVIMNLVINARDAMPKGGRLVVKTSNLLIAGSVAGRPSEVPPGSYAVLSMTDTGEGIPAEVLPKIFEPFFTTKGFGQGTGLGLATVYGIVKQSEGFVTVSSTVGCGTTFTIYLPISVEPVAYQTNQILEPVIPKGKETILLVEDEASVRRLSQTVLESYGYTVWPASNGPDALQVVNQISCSPDLLVTDVIMPHMDGRELADQLTSRFPKLKVLFMSGYSGDILKPHGVTPLNTMFIQKPFSPASLAQKVREILELKR